MKDFYLKKGKTNFIQSLVDEKRSIIILESPNRILKTLKDMNIWVISR